MNPADDAFHAVLKRKFNEELARVPVPTEADKIEIAFKAFYDVLATAIAHYFDHTGLTSGRPTAVMERLLDEGKRVMSAWYPLHSAQARSFRVWCDRNQIDPACIMGVDERLEDHILPLTRSSRSKAKGKK